MAIKDRIDGILNWTGGSYVGASTLTVLGLAIAEFCSGKPVSVAGPKGPEIYILHQTPEWLIGVPFGVFMIILTLYVAQKPVNTWIGNRTGVEKPPPAGA